MGIQSQLQLGSVKKCKKKAANTKKKKLSAAAMTVHRGKPFLSHAHCYLCQKKHQKLSNPDANMPRRGHHDACPNKPKNKKKQKTTLHTLGAVAVAEAHLERHKVNRNQPKNAKNKATTINKNSKAHLMSSVAVAEATMDMMGVDPAALMQPLLGEPKPVKQLNLATEIRKDIHPRMNPENSEECKHLQDKTNANVPLLHAIACVTEHVCFRRMKSAEGMLPSTEGFGKAFERCKQFFPPKSCLCAFPKDASRVASPCCHQIEGHSALCLDWNMCHPGTPLPCPDCHNVDHDDGTPRKRGCLVHEKTNWSKNWSLFPIWNNNGTITWCVLMSCTCPVCHASVQANDGRLLQLLPPHVSATFPVHPRFCTGICHLNRDLTNNIECLMKTCANAEFVSTTLHKKQAKEHTRRCHACFSQAATSNFVSFEDCIMHNHPPNGASVRKLHQHAEHSVLTPCNHSKVERHTRETQAVQLDQDDMLGLDHAWGPNHACGGIKKSTTLTGIKGKTKEVLFLFVVPTTSLDDAAHGLQQAKENHTKFEPGVVETDTCPNGKHFFKGPCGQQVECRLGLFHFMQRITKTMDDRSKLHGKALRNLKDALHTCNEDDMKALEACLREGTFFKHGDALTDVEINELKESKEWKQKCDPCLRKEFHAATQMKSNLKKWLEEFEGQQDSFARPAFTDATRKATEDQCDKIKHILDNEKDATYTQLPPSNNTTHKLLKWQSNRPESSLEKFHLKFAHFANTGSSKELADALMSRGTAEHNVKMRWRCHCWEHRRQGKNLPHHFKHVDNLPLFNDHSYLEVINAAAAARGLQKPFEFVAPSTQDNGEVFLSKYHCQQLDRINALSPVLGTSLCQCLQCAARRPETTECDPESPSNEPNLPAQEHQQQQAENTQQQEEISTAAINAQPNPAAVPAFVQPTGAPIAALSTHWLSSDHWCFYFPSVGHCMRHGNYLNRKNRGERILGRPPHCPNCPKSPAVRTCC